MANKSVKIILKGDAILKQISKDVQFPLSDEIHSCREEMINTMVSIVH